MTPRDPSTYVPSARDRAALYALERGPAHIGRAACQTEPALGRVGRQDAEFFEHMGYATITGDTATLTDAGRAALARGREWVARGTWRPK